MKPWLPSVERLGTGNANLLCNAGFAQKIGEHMYYIDGDWNLHVSPYDRVDDRLIVDSEAAYINLSSDKVYFLHDNALHDTIRDADVWPVYNSGSDSGHVQGLYAAHRSPDFRKCQQ